jgi:hypothetical protein
MAYLSTKPSLSAGVSVAAVLPHVCFSYRYLSSALLQEYHPSFATRDAIHERGDVMEAFKQYKEWFTEFSAGYPLFVEGDDLGSTFLGSGAVLLLMAAPLSSLPAWCRVSTGRDSVFSSASRIWSKRSDGILQITLIFGRPWNVRWSASGSPPIQVGPQGYSAKHAGGCWRAATISGGSTRRDGRSSSQSCRWHLRPAE